MYLAINYHLVEKYSRTSQSTCSCNGNFLLLSHRTLIIELKISNLSFSTPQGKWSRRYCLLSTKIKFSLKRLLHHAGSYLCISKSGTNKRKCVEYPYNIHGHTLKSLTTTSTLELEMDSTHHPNHQESKLNISLSITQHLPLSTEDQIQRSPNGSSDKEEFDF